MSKDLKVLQRKFDLKELEVNSLLEITQAINDNLPADALFRIYDFTIRANLNIGKLALFVLDEKWVCRVNFGTEKDYHSIKLPDEIGKSSGDLTPSKLKAPFNEFEIIVPVKHKSAVLAYVFASATNRQGEEVNTVFLQTISNLIIVAIENKKLAKRQLREEAFRKELEIAKEVQKLLFPEDLPYGVRLKIEASYLPHQSVGGDYYDYIPINKNQFLICIADVSGKGIPAALMMSNFQASLRTLLRTTRNLTEIIEILNFQILENAKGENFITFFAAIYDHNINTLVYVNAGHNPPIIVNSSGEVKELDEGCTILGMFHPLPFINEGFVPDLDSFLLFLYTDGLTETENEKEEEFGHDRVRSIIEKNKAIDLKELHGKLLTDLDDYRGTVSYRDDITLLSCRLEQR